MPSRVIRGEILASESLSRVSMQAEFVFWRLFVAADDFGRLDGRLGVLRAAIFPTRDAVTLGEIGRWLDELTCCDPDGHGPVQRYEVDSRPYLQLRSWEKHRANGKRATKSRFPEAPEIPRGSPRAPADPHPSDVWYGDEGRGTLAPAGAPPAAEGSASGPSKRRALARPPKPAAHAIAIYCEEYKAARGVNPVVPEREKRELGAAYEDMGEERFRAACRVFLITDDDWLRQQSYSPRAFLSRLTQSDVRAQKRAGRGPPEPEPNGELEPTPELTAIFGGKR